MNSLQTNCNGRHQKRYKNQLFACLGIIGALSCPAHTIMAGVDIASFFGGPSADSVDATVHFTPASTEGPGPSTPQMTDNRFRGNILIGDKKSGWNFLQRLSHLDMNTSPVIDNTGLSAPTSLWDCEVGGVLRRDLSEGREWGMNGSVGSASDDPFQSMEETTLRLGAFYSRPSGANNAWLFSLNYSNNRYFANNIPLPGIAYYLQTADQRLSGLIGFPFLGTFFRPTPRLSGRIFMFGPTSLSAETSVSVKGPFRAYGGFDWNQQSWLRSDRDERKNRLFYDCKKWSVGMRTPLIRMLTADLSTGYEYNRRFFEGKSATETIHQQADLASTWFMQLKLMLRFTPPNVLR